MAEQQKKRKKGIARGKRRNAKIAHYYEFVLPLRKLRRIWRDSHSMSLLSKWADAYVTPTGVSGNGALVRLKKLLQIA